MKSIIIFYLIIFFLFGSDAINLARKRTWKFLSQNAANKVYDPEKANEHAKKILEIATKSQKLMAESVKKEKEQTIKMPGDLTDVQKQVANLNKQIASIAQIQKQTRNGISNIKVEKLKKEEEKKLEDAAHLIQTLKKSKEELQTMLKKFQASVKSSLKKSQKIFEKTQKIHEKVEKNEKNTEMITKQKNEIALEKAENAIKFRSSGSFSQAENENARNDLASVSKACFQGVISSIPGDFCWKKGTDFGKIPTDCPTNFDRSLALCIENCKAGYHRVAGVCWQICKKPYKDRGVSCWKSSFNWHFKKSYVTMKLSNFDSRVPCPEGLYKSGALCYRDCSKIGYANCGIGACAANKASCKSTISSMVMDTQMAIAGNILKFVSFGAAAPVSKATQLAVRKLGKAGLQASFNIAKSFIKLQVQKNFPDFIQKIVKKSMIFVSESIKRKIKEIDIKQICEGTLDSLAKQMDKKNEPGDPLKSIDFLAVSKATESCTEKLSSSSAKIKCAKNIMGLVASYDPTGLVSVASTFMHPICPKF